MKFNRKLLGSLVLISLASLILVAGASYAFFTDAQSANDNQITSGTLSIQVDGCPNIALVNLPNMKPGDTGTTANWLVSNNGTIAGNLSISMSAINNSENGINKPEQVAGDISADVGELGEYLKVAMWMDVDRNGEWGSGDYYLAPGGTTVAWVSGTTVPVAAYNVLDSFWGATWTNTQTDLLGGANAGTFQIVYGLPDETGNIVQSDSCAFNLTFTLEQYH